MLPQIHAKLIHMSTDDVFDMVTVTVDSLDGEDAEAYADDYFDYNGYINREGYINLLLTCNNGRKAQIINFNINYIFNKYFILF